MALRVWLPLNGKIENIGLDNGNIRYNTNATIDNNGIIGQCYKFTPSQTIQYTFGTQPTSPVGTIMCWVRFDVNTTSGHVCLLKVGGDGSGYDSTYLCLWFYDNRFNVYVRGSGTSANYSFTNEITLEKWYHLAVTYDGATAKVYKNGVLLGSTDIAGGSNNKKHSFLIGGNNSSTTVYSPNYGLNGAMNDVRYYDNVLSQAEIKEIAKGLCTHFLLTNVKKNFAEKIVPIAWASSISSISTENGITSMTVNNTNSGVIRYQNLGFNGRTGPWHVSFDFWSSIATTVAPDVCNKYTDNISSSNDLHSSSTIGKLLVPANTWTRIEFNFLNPINQYNTPNNHNGFCDINWLVSNTSAQFKIRNMLICEYSDLLIEYDCSGYCNDATKTNITAEIIPSPRYIAATHVTNSTSYQFFNPLKNIFTISFWYDAHENTNTRYMPLSTANGNKLNLYFRDHQMAWGIYDGIQNPFYVTGTTTIISTTPYEDTWHFYTITSDGTTIKLYIDGQLIGNAKTWRGYTGDSFLIMDTVGGSYGANKYAIVDFRMYGTTLSAEDVLTLYNTSMSIDNEGNLSARILTS